MMIQTYILRLNEFEYYCGKTENLKKILQQHRKNKSINDYIVFDGDYEKEIKRAGVKLVYTLVVWGCLHHDG